MKIEGEEDADGDFEPSYLVVISPSQPFAWTGGVMTVDLDLINLELQDNRARVIADGPGARFTLVKQIFEQCIEDLDLPCVVQQQAHLPAIQKELAKIARSTYRLSESFISSASLVHASLRGSAGSQDLIENWYLFASDHGRRVAFQIEDTSLERFSRLLMRLGISWVSFICDSCDPTDRKTFRWTVQALDYALKVTGDMQILHLDSSEFTALKKSVASLVSLLISHFDILGARSSMEAKREAERIAAMRRLQRLQENLEDDDLAMQKVSTGQDNPDRSIRLVREERLRLIAELEERRTGFVNEARLVGQVLDEEVAEDRSLVFLAASSSNIALRWQQGAFIGGGANGNVYMGFNIDSGGVMAVKEIRVQDIHSSPALYKQIKEESDVMSMLSHPHIVEYYGIEVSPF
jgi:mitogen-activated protein kinase kinase kinase